MQLLHGFLIPVTKQNYKYIIFQNSDSFLNMFPNFIQTHLNSKIFSGGDVEIWNW